MTSRPKMSFQIEAALSSASIWNDRPAGTTFRRSLFSLPVSQPPRTKISSLPHNNSPEGNVLPTNHEKLKTSVPSTCQKKKLGIRTISLRPAFDLTFSGGGFYALPLSTQIPPKTPAIPHFPPNSIAPETGRLRVGHNVDFSDVSPSFHQIHLNSCPTSSRLSQHLHSSGRLQRPTLPTVLPPSREAPNLNAK